MSKKTPNLIMILAIASLIQFCKPTPEKRKTAANGSDDKPALKPKAEPSNSKPQTTPIAPNEPRPPLYLAPSRARAKIDRHVKMAPTSLIQDLEFPNITISFDQADFVRILRCPKSYQAKTLTGEDVSVALGRPGQEGALAWVWAQAIEDRNRCKVVGNNIATKVFTDLAAPKGSYYYMVNPCISKERSLYGVADCSYRLQITDPITIKNSLSKLTQDAAKKLSQAEATLNGSLQSAILLARKIEIHLRACEDMVAFDNEALNFKKGLIQLGIMVVGLGVGQILGGPNIAIMMGQMGTQMISSVLFTKVLKWPPAFANECIDPEIKKTTKEQREKLAKESPGDPSHQLKYKGRYEEEFNVQTLSKELKKLVNPEDGKIQKDTEALKAAMLEMQKLGINILTLDQAQSKAANQGIDTSDPKTFSVL